MNTLKMLIDELHLEKFYNDFIREDYSYNYFVEIYLYKVKYKDGYVMYLGNRTVPNSECYDYSITKYREADYWLNGTNDTYIILYRYDSTCNMTGYDSEYNKLGNQGVLNNIKQCIIDKLKTNFNIQLMPKDYDIFEQIGKQIQEWKTNIKNEIKNYKCEDFIEDFKTILYEIKNNTIYWHKFLITSNRFWFISLNEEDIEERKLIKFDDLTIQQRVIVIVMKEWLAMIVNNSQINPNYNMHIDKVIYKLENTYYKNEELFMHSKTKLFQHNTAIKLLLSTMYNKSTQKQVEDTYNKFMSWRRNYITKIFNN